MVCQTYGLHSSRLSRKRRKSQKRRKRRKRRRQVRQLQTKGWVLDSRKSRKPRKWRKPRESRVQTIGSPNNGFIQDVGKGGLSLRGGGSLHDGFGRFDGFGGSGLHLALLLLVLQNTVPSGSCDGFDSFGKFGGCVAFGRDGSPLKLNPPFPTSWFRNNQKNTSHRRFSSRGLANLAQDGCHVIVHLVGSVACFGCMLSSLQLRGETRYRHRCLVAFSVQADRVQTQLWCCLAYMYTDKPWPDHWGWTFAPAIQWWGWESGTNLVNERGVFAIHPSFVGEKLKGRSLRG